MRRLWYNGRVDTMGVPMVRHEAIGIQDGTILFLGSDREALSQFWDETTNLEGKQVLPGFSDTHVHLLHYALFQKNLPLFAVSSIETMIRLGRERIARDHPACLLGMGWNQEQLAEKRMPCRQDLDRISTEIPICMLRACAHVAACNTVMVKRLQAIKGKVEPSVWAKVDTEWGLLREEAMRLYLEIIPPESEEEIQTMIRRGAAELNAAGITCVHSDDLQVLPGVHPNRLVDLFRQVEREGTLTVRVYEQCLLDPEQLEPFQAARSAPSDRASLFRTGPRKLLQDGSLGAKSAELMGGYADDPHNHGIPIHGEEELYQLIQAAHSRRMDVAVHAIGDLALQKVCDAVERVQREDPWPQARHGVVHAQITTPVLLRRMRELNLQAYIQPIFLDADMKVVAQRVGEERAKTCYHWKSMLELGLHVSGGSDCPVEPFSILDNLRAAVTRRNRAGTDTFLPDQALTVEEGLRLFTSYAAWASRDEKVRGTLEVGKQADLVVLDGDLFQSDPEAFPEVNVWETVLNGATVYHR